MKKQLNKRGEMTMQSFLVLGILGIMVFSGLFLFYTSEINNSAIPMNTFANDTYDDITQKMSEINQTTSSLSDDVYGLGEEGFIGTIITTLSGFSNMIKLLGQSLGFGTDLVNVGLHRSGLTIPSWFTSGVLIIIAIVVLFLVIKAISGREKI